MKTIIIYLILTITIKSMFAQNYFMKTYEGYSTGLHFIKSTMDSGFILKTPDELIKIDKYGDIKWSTYFNFTGNFLEHHVVELKDSSIILTLNKNFSNSKFSVVKIDKDGNIIFSKNYYTSDGYPPFKSLFSFNINDTILSYVLMQDSIIKAYKISSMDGDTITSQHIYSSPQKILLYHFIQNDNNNYLVFIRENSPNELMIVKFNKSFNDLLDMFSVFVSDSFWPYYMVGMLNNENFAIFSSDYDLKINLSFWKNFEELFSTSITPLSNYIFYNYAATNTQNFYIFCGKYYPIALYTEKGYLLGVNKEGEELFFKEFLPSGYNTSSFRHVISKDDYIAAIGSTKNSLTDKFEVLVVKTDLNGNITNIQNHNAQNELLVYPNPSTDFITFETTFELPATLYLYNSMGQLLEMKKITEQQTTIDLTRFKPQLIFYQISGKTGIISLLKN